MSYEHCPACCHWLSPFRSNNICPNCGIYVWSENSGWEKVPRPLDTLPSAIRRVINRIKNNPSNIWEQHRNFSEGLEAATINALAGRPVILFEDKRFLQDRHVELWLTFHHPTGKDKVAWRTWHSAQPLEIPTQEKITRTVDCLEAWIEGEQGNGPNPAKDEKERESEQTRRMTAEEANAKAMKLAHKMRTGFFALSERQQAKLIGCSWKTWRKTEFYPKAQAERPAGKRSKTSSPKAESLTAGREAVTGEGDKDEVLQQLIAEQEADKEPSPLESHQRKIHSRKRL